MMPLKVCCAIIEHQGRVLAVQRSARMKQALLWEFPGGKQEAGETAEQCIVREVREELNIDIQPLRQLSAHMHTYEKGSILLIPFVCKWVEGTLELREHKTARWLLPEELKELNWSPADIPVAEAYLTQHQVK